MERTGPGPVEVILCTPWRDAQVKQIAGQRSSCDVRVVAVLRGSRRR